MVARLCSHRRGVGACWNGQSLLKGGDAVLGLERYSIFFSDVFGLIVLLFRVNFLVWSRDGRFRGRLHPNHNPRDRVPSPPYLVRRSDVPLPTTDRNESPWRSGRTTNPLGLHAEVSHIWLGATGVC